MAKKPTPEPVIYEPTSLTANDGKEYAVDHVKDLFINSEQSITELAIQLNLPVETVEKCARRGLRSWYQLKKDRLEDRMAYFMDVNIDNLMETHSLLEDGHGLQIIQMKGQIEFLKAYYLRHGHLNMLDADQELVLDAYGMPIPLPMPTGAKNLMVLDGLLKLKDGTKKEINFIHEQIKESRSAKDVRVEDYDIFDEKDD